MLCSASHKAKLFAKNFCKNSNLSNLNSSIPLPAFSSRTNLKLHNISVTPKMIKNVKMNLDLSKRSAPRGTLVVVLKTCQPKLSYILVELFNLCLKESCFPDCWKVSLVIPVFKIYLHNLKSYEISGDMFDLISSSVSNSRHCVVLEGKFS